MHVSSTLRLATTLILVLVFSSWNRADASAWLPATVSLDRASVYDAALAPSEPTRIFAITVGWGLYRSDDRGTSWNDLTQSLPVERILETIAVSPHDPDLALLGAEQPATDTAVLLRTVDGGETWSESMAGIIGKRVTSLAFDPLDPSVVYAATGWADPSGVYRSDDAGLTWSLKTGALGDVRVHALVVDPLDPDVLVGLTVSGYIRSTDRGENWMFHPTPDRFSSISASPVSPSLFYATSNDAVYKSTDGGASFSPIPTPSGWVFYPIVADPHSSSGVFLGGWDSCTKFDAGTVWKSTNGGSTWTEIFQAPDCGELVSAILLDPTSPSVMSIATEGRDGIFSSTNGGASWIVRNTGIHSYAVGLLRSDGAGRLYGRGGDQISLTAIAPDGPWAALPAPFFADIYAFEPGRGTAGLLYECGQGTPSDYYWPYMMVSTNGGAIWLPPLGELPNGLAGTPRLVAPAWDDRTAYVFDFDGIYRSEDVNQTYTRTGDEIEVEAAVVDPTDSDRLFAARRYDPVVMMTTDGGATWNPRDAGLPNEACVHLEIDPADPLHLLVVFRESGAWETTDGGETWENVIPFDAGIRSADWNPATGNVYLCTQGSGIVSNDERVTDEGAITTFPIAVIHAEGADALVMSTGNGLYYQLLSDPAAVEGTMPGSALLQLRVAPNPSSGQIAIVLSSTARLLGNAGVVVDVHDVRGRLVRSLEGGAIVGTDLRWNWDTRDAQGRTVPAGMYFLRARVANASDSWRASEVVVVTR